MNPEKQASASDTVRPQYDRRQTYQWNYEHAPVAEDESPAAVAGRWQFCGLDVDSPLGMPAGPLLNGQWCLYYASLGFDVLTYKTVRSVEHACYGLPNLQPVACEQLQGDETDLRAVESMQGSWAVSFGMPSTSPDVWRADIEQTRKALPTGKLLSVSVVGTMQTGWLIDDLADDYAQCARWAVESGADCIESNFSCPNVCTTDGQIYQHADQARTVAARVRAAIGDLPYIIKVGHIRSLQDTTALLDAVAPWVDAIGVTNSVATTIVDREGKPLFDGQKRGICGDATREASLAQTRMMAQIIDEQDHDVELIGVGGVSTAQHVRQYLDAGAMAVHIASAAMNEPGIALKIRQQLSE